MSTTDEAAPVTVAPPAKKAFAPSDPAPIAMRGTDSVAIVLEPLLKIVTSLDIGEPPANRILSPTLAAARADDALSVYVVHWAEAVDEKTVIKTRQATTEKRDLSILQ